MFWKNWPYWVRGGISGLGVLILSDIFIHFLQEPCTAVGDACYDKVHPITIPLGKFLSSIDIFYYGISPFVKNSEWFGKELYHVFTIWPSIVFIGAIIGWLYGKIKSRRFFLKANS